MGNHRRLWVAVIAVACILLIGARKPDVPAPDPALGSIGVKIKTKGPTGISAPCHGAAVYFVKVDDGTDIHAADEILISNFQDKKQVYLLNVEPGQYVAVGAYAESNMDVPDASVYFDKEMIAATTVTVEPGKIAFMGDIVVKISVGMKKADEAQNHYADMLGRGIGFSTGIDVNVRTGQSTGSLRLGRVTRAGTLKSIQKDPETEQDFWAKAVEKVFRNEPPWRELINTQLGTPREQGS